MKKFFTVTTLLIIIFFSYCNIIAQDKKMLNNLMPVPAKLTYGEGKLKIDSTFTISIQGNCSNNFYEYTTRILRRLSGRTGLFFTQDVLTKKNSLVTAQMIIDCKRAGKVELKEDESYSLEVTNGGIKLSANTDIGAMRGLETFVQLLESNQEGYYFPLIKIEDSPRFPWRGLMIDACRHFMPIDVIKRNLDGMATVKMNVFHWHLTDDQGIRVECKSLPKLHELASDGMYYTQEQIKEIMAYAEARGIRVIPEFDIPGHSTSWLTAYPELASAPGPYTVERKWGVFDPTFNPTIEATYQLFDKFFGEMSKLFKDPYIHIGGDENNGKQWNNNKDIQAFMKKNNIENNHALQAYFNKRISKIITKYGKKMIGWDEIQHPDLPKDIVIQSWRGQKGLVEAAKNGFQVILSNGYYIDLMQNTDAHYLNDPIPANSPLTDAEKKLVLGGEATSWAELVTPENVDSRIWPRTAVIAERFWSPENVTDVPDMYRRLDRISYLLEDAGLMHIKNQAMMLRRLTNNNDITPLKTFIDVLEPVKNYSRHSQGKSYTSYSPYTRVVDAAWPDVKLKRTLNNSVDEYLAKKDESSYNEIKNILTSLKNNHEALLKTIELSPVLKEMQPSAECLNAIVIKGLEALEYIHSNNNPDKSWISNSADDIKAAKKPVGQTEIAIVPSIEKLINSVNK